MAIGKIVSVEDLSFLSCLTLFYLGRFLRATRSAELICRMLGVFSYVLLRDRSGDAKRGLRICFGDSLDEDRQKKIIKASFTQYWRDWVWMKEPRILDCTDVAGRENLTEALASRTGIIIWEPGVFGRRFTGMHIRRDLHINPTQIHHVRHFGSEKTWVRDNVTRPLLEKLEAKYNSEVITITDDENLRYARLISKRLISGNIVCTSGDGYHGKRFVSISFLGGIADFATGVISAARLTGSYILPVFCLEHDKHRLRYVIHKPLKVPATISAHDENKFLQDLACLYESYVKEHPEQYRGWHSLRAA